MNLLHTPCLVDRSKGYVEITPCQFIPADALWRDTREAERQRRYREAHPEYVERNRVRMREYQRRVRHAGRQPQQQGRAGG